MSHLKIPKSVVIRIMKVAMGKRKLFARFVPRSLTPEHREDRVAFSIFKNSWILMMGQIGCPETTVRNYFYSQLNNPGQRRSHLLLGGSLKSHLSRLLFMINIFVCIRQRLALIMYICLCIYGPGSVVGIAIVYELDGPGIESRWGRDFPHLSRPVLWPAQPPVQWIPGLSRG